MKEKKKLKKKKLNWIKEKNIWMKGKKMLKVEKTELVKEKSLLKGNLV